jgi:hypothetical protein
MAMFDLKDSEDIKLSECHTDSPTLIKGEGLKRLEVDSSSAFTEIQQPKPKVITFLLDHLFAACLSLAVTVAGGYMIFEFGWTG